jgi:hypothetical protein
MKWRLTNLCAARLVIGWVWAKPLRETSVVVTRRTAGRSLPNRKFPGFTEAGIPLRNSGPAKQLACTLRLHHSRAQALHVRVPHASDIAAIPRLVATGGTFSRLRGIPNGNTWGPMFHLPGREAEEDPHEVVGEGALER